jgi:F1F0 ATPase subunit 2
VTDWLSLGASLVAGSSLAVVHFVGLWLTVRRVPSSSRSLLLLLGSSFARTGVTLTGFFVVASVDSSQLALCLAAFLLTRVVVLRRLGGQVAPALNTGRNLWN